MKNFSRFIIIALILSSIVISLGWADEYYNSRFGFKIVYPAAWNIHKNPAPANGDGISFSLPGNCSFIACGSHNALQNNLENEVKSRVDDGTITREGKFSISGVPAKRVIFRNKNKMTIMYVAIKNDIVYACYYSGPVESFSKNAKQANKVLSTFTIR